jgi:hypothetical protein
MFLGRPGSAQPTATPLEPDVIHYYLTRPKQAPGTCKKHSLHL